MTPTYSIQTIIHTVIQESLKSFLIWFCIISHFLKALGGFLLHTEIVYIQVGLMTSKASPCLPLPIWLPLTSLPQSVPYKCCHFSLNKEHSSRVFIFCASCLSLALSIHSLPHSLHPSRVEFIFQFQFRCCLLHELSAPMPLSCHVIYHYSTLHKYFSKVSGSIWVGQLALIFHHMIFMQKPEWTFWPTPIFVDLFYPIECELLEERDYSFPYLKAKPRAWHNKHSGSVVKMKDWLPKRLIMHFSGLSLIHRVGTHPGESGTFIIS